MRITEIITEATILDPKYKSGTQFRLSLASPKGKHILQLIKDPHNFPSFKEEYMIEKVSNVPPN